jgi:hypothetical protein
MPHVIIAIATTTKTALDSLTLGNAERELWERMGNILKL